MRAQSAMEYLMTYGWAILIIAIVLAALFQLGVFNSTNFAPKAPPGSCQVFRPDGPGSTQFISTEGLCNGEMPQYVATFNPNYYTYINTTLEYPPDNTVKPFTLSVWINEGTGCNYNTKPNVYCGILDGDNGAQGWGLMGGGNYVDFWIQGTTQDMTFVVQENRWVNVVVTYAYVGSSWVSNGYVDGVLEDSNAPRSPVTLPQPYGFRIGDARQTSAMVFNGSISNIQFYNTSLTSNEVAEIYQAGIGGAPIDLQNLVAWYPLNGNANDYSGNGYNGNAINVAFTGAWTSGYTQP